MLAEVPLIDLDRPPPPAPGRPSLAARPFLLVATLFAVLLTLGGAMPVPPGLTPVLTVNAPATTFELAAGVFFLATRSEVRRYDLPSGTTRWRHGFDQMPMSLRYNADAGVLLSLSNVNPALSPGLTALDAATGRQLWSAEARDTLVISLSRSGLLTEHDDYQGRSWLRLVDARTGGLIWTRPIEPAGFLGPDDLFTTGSPRIVTVGPTGRVVVISYADGRVLSEGELGPSGEPGHSRNVLADSTAVSVVGDRLYLARRSNGHTSMTAYSVHPLTELWRVADGAPLGTVTDCGPVLCVADARWVSAMDPAGGGLRWSQPAWGIAYRYDATRLFAYDNQEEADAALLDAATGRVVRRLGPSRQVGDLVLRADGARTWVSVPDPAVGVLRTAGALTDVAYLHCRSAGSYLACPTFSGQIRLWRVR